MAASFLTALHVDMLGGVSVSGFHVAVRLLGMLGVDIFGESCSITFRSSLLWSFPISRR